MPAVQPAVQPVGTGQATKRNAQQLALAKAISSPRPAVVLSLLHDWINSGGDNEFAVKCLKVSFAKMNEKGQTEDMLSLYQRAGSFIDLPYELHSTAARIYAHQGDMEQSFHAVNAAIGKNQHAARDYTFRATLWVLCGERDKAKADIRRAVALGKTDFTMERAVSDARTLSGEFREGDHILTGRSSEPKHAPLAAQERSVRTAESSLALGRYHEAFDLASSLAQKDPDNPRLLRVMAISAQAMGDKVRASELRKRLRTIKQP